MELHGIGGLPNKMIRGIFHIGRGGDHLRPYRQGRYSIAVRHPHLGFGLHALQKRRIGHHAQHGAAIFAGVGGLHLPTAIKRQILSAVANAKQRQLAPEQGQVHLRGIGVPHAAGAAGQDNALHGIVQGRHLVIGVNFAIDVQFPQATADQLRHLGTEIQDQYLIHYGSS